MLYHILAVITVCVWGTTFVSTKVLLLHGLTPSDIFFLRFLLAYVGMALCVRRRWRCSCWQDELKMLLAGMAGGSLYFMTENTALELIPAGRVSLLVCTTPLVTAVLATCLNRENTSGRGLWIGSVAAFVGVALVVRGNDEGSFHLAGIILSLCASFLWAIYQIVCRPLSEKYGAEMLTRKVLGYGLLTILPYIFCGGGKRPGELTVVMVSDHVVLLNLLYLGLIASLACYYLWSLVIRRLGVVVSANYIYLNPLVTCLFSFFLLDESFSAAFIFGAALIVVGVYVAVRNPHSA